MSLLLPSSFRQQRQKRNQSSSVDRMLLHHIPRLNLSKMKSHFAEQASTSCVDEDIDIPVYLFEELLDKDSGSSSNWYDFSDDENKLSDDTDAWFSDSKEPSSPKDVPFFDPVSVGDWDFLIASLKKSTDQEDLWTEAEPWFGNTLGNPEGLVELEASENIVEEPPSNLPTEDYVQKIDLRTPDNPRPIFIGKCRAPEPGSLQRSDLGNTNWEVSDNYISP
ncbi:hypothetical protein AAC387_Pa10g0575 [Persea americana]